MKQIQGTPASMGTVEGIARVIKKLEHADKFAKGDILVAVAISPAWTPLIFASSAVVTDVGGSLSHAAIVSREYGIPCSRDKGWDYSNKR